MAYHFFRSGLKGYNIDFSVGQGGVNLKDDVMLVQTMLHILFHENKDPFIASTFPPLPDVSDFDISGTVDSTTSRYILHFKTLVMQLGEKLYPDKIMDPYRNNDNPFQKSTISKTTYAYAVLESDAFATD